MTYTITKYKSFYTEAEWTEIVTGYWIVDKMWFSEEHKRRGINIPYPFWLEGHYKNSPEKGWFWGSSFDSLFDRQYDFSQTQVIV